jgi:hypothetical protein
LPISRSRGLALSSGISGYFADEGDFVEASPKDQLRVWTTKEKLATVDPITDQSAQKRAWEYISTNYLLLWAERWRVPMLGLGGPTWFVWLTNVRRQGIESLDGPPVHRSVRLLWVAETESCSRL